MKRLKDLDVMEVSAVKAAANRKKFAILKNQQGASMATAPRANDALAEKLLLAFASIPKDKIAAIEHITKTAKARIRKADDDAVADDADGTGLTQDAQDALRSAFRMLAPYSDEISSDVISDFADALGVQADVDDAEEADDDVDVPDDLTKAADGNLKEDEGVQKADDGDDEDDVKKAADGDAKDDENDVKKADLRPLEDGADNQAMPQEESLAKADGMPDFADASDADTAAAMDAARKAFSEAMLARGKKEASQKSADGPGLEGDKKDEQPLMKSAVEKSALKGLPKDALNALEPIFKAHNERFAAMERQNRELVQKSAELADTLKRREFVQKAAAQYAGLGRAEDIGEAMFALHKADPTGVAAWETILKAADAQARAGGAQGMFAEIGTAMGNNGHGNAMAQIQAHVNSVVQKSAHGKTPEQIEAEFYETPAGRALYAQDRREKNH